MAAASEVPPRVEVASLRHVGHQLRELIDESGGQRGFLAEGQVVEVEASGGVRLVQDGEHGVPIRVAGAESSVALDLGHGPDSMTDQPTTPCQVLAHPA